MGGSGNGKRIELAVERAAEQTLSQQPRFQQKDREGFFSAVVQFIKRAMDEWDVPRYIPDSRKRDAWLRENWSQEPHWAGIVNQMILVDSSRGWTLTGGRNQVRKYTGILHDAEQGAGWRNFFRKSSRSYRITDIGSMTEIGTDGEDGPLRALYHLDSARCRWSNDLEEPLFYYPSQSKARMQRWKPGDFFNVVALPSDNEKFRGLGWCATSRAFEIIKLLYGVLMHDQEMVGAKMPRGLLLLKGLDETQWADAMSAREGQLSGLERKYFGGVFVMASLGGGEEVDAKLVALSQLPTGFDRNTFIDQCMYAYALVAGYDPREFWPVSSGTLGTGTETETQHQKASTKGALEYPHAFQEKLQQRLPESLHFEFEERDAHGQLLDAEVAQAWSDVATTLGSVDPVSGLPLLPREQVLSLLVDQGIIPPEYTEFEEEAQATDVEATRMCKVRERALSTPHVLRAAARFPKEPIVRYTWRPGYESEVQLWDSGVALLQRRSFPGMQVQRQDDLVLYEDPESEVVITEADVERAIAQWDRRMPEDARGLLDAMPAE